MWTQAELVGGTPSPGLPTPHSTVGRKKEGGRGGREERRKVEKGEREGKEGGRGEEREGKREEE